MTDPYTAGMISTDPFHKKQVVQGRIVAVLSNKFDKRGITLMPQPSRAFLKNEIHELLLTDENVSPNDTVNRIWGLGFFEIDVPGIIVEGDTVNVSGHTVGTVAGFNDTHMPNHLNIVIHSLERKTGAELEIELQDTVILRKENA